MNGTMLLILAGWYVAASMAACVVFAVDKQLATRGMRRVPERTLHGLSWAGGFPGSIAAMWVVRHKNRKVGFVVMTVAAAVGHVGFWIALLTVWRRG
jgi:uncharacterized membrane protein YsdA (DUF1294 family)